MSTKLLRLSPVIHILIACVVAGCSQLGLGPTPQLVYVTPGPVITNPPAIASSAKPNKTAEVTYVTEPPESTMQPAGDTTAALNEAVPIVTLSDGSDLGTVTVVKSKKYASLSYSTASTGNTFVGVYVRYLAAASFTYGSFDWAAHDPAGNQYEAAFVDIDPALGSGTLAAKRKREGWISFEVPKKAAHLWADFKSYGGAVIFSVRVY